MEASLAGGYRFNKMATVAAYYKVAGKRVRE